MSYCVCVCVCVVVGGGYPLPKPNHAVEGRSRGGALSVNIRVLRDQFTKVSS